MCNVKSIIEYVLSQYYLGTGQSVFKYSWWINALLFIEFTGDLIAGATKFAWVKLTKQRKGPRSQFDLNGHSATAKQQQWRWAGQAVQRAHLSSRSTRKTRRPTRSAACASATRYIHTNSKLCQNVASHISKKVKHTKLFVVFVFTIVAWIESKLELFTNNFVFTIPF